MTFKELVKRVLRTNSHADIELIQKAYTFSQHAYKDTKRLSGDTLLDHTVTSALIIADLKLDEHSIIAGLLHHCHDFGITIDDISKAFDKETAGLIQGLQSISSLKAATKNTPASADLRKILLATAKDVRILIVKLCIKLHNMRTLSFLPDEEQRKRISQEVLDLYSPLAYRLGMGSIKSELEDLAFQHTHPELYHEILEKINESEKERAYRLYEAHHTLEQELKRQGINAEITGRVKHIYSIYKKIVDRAYKFENIKDLSALRVITATAGDCYTILGIIHTLWRPLPDTFKDYIATPKQNGYQSLHTVVVGPRDRPLEFQIRTKAMHLTSEEGAAVHYGYKGITHGQEVDKKLSWLKQLVEQRESLTDKEFKEALQLDLFSDTIFVLTPRGRVVELPQGATVLDFAYAIHTDLGSKAIGATINGKYNSLRTELHNGDIIEVVTSKTQQPGSAWLSLVKTANARSKIRHSLRTKGRPFASRTTFVQEQKHDVEEGLIAIEGAKNPAIKLASCCKPLPGQKIIGIRTGQDKVTIHTPSCTSLSKMPLKEVNARWLERLPSDIELVIEAHDRVGLLAEILNTISRRGFNVLHARAKTVPGNNAQCFLTLHIEDTTTLIDLIQRIKNVKDVTNVFLGELKKN
ncbi:MAG TPA: RelA/SpoT family protein [Candidatus Nanoarchaeia archaeon]|nr:RelA/SpoT family protein [Candidatus Nanoarchaeia archaeon]